MDTKDYTDELQKALANHPYMYSFAKSESFWSIQDTFDIASLDGIVQHGMSEEFTPAQLADRLYQVATAWN